MKVVFATDHVVKRHFIQRLFELQADGNKQVEFRFERKVPSETSIFAATMAECSAAIRSRKPGLPSTSLARPKPFRYVSEPSAVGPLTSRFFYSLTWAVYAVALMVLLFPRTKFQAFTTHGST